MRTKQILISLLSVAPLCVTAKPSSFPHVNNLHARQDTTPVKKADEAAAWYPSWLGKSFPPDKVSWEKYSSMTFAFGLTTPDSSVISLDDDSKALLPVFVSEARKNGVNALLSVGGWTGSQYFSPAVATAENRTQFVKAVVGVAKEYNLDGIDFDWEYPGKDGIGCNINTPNDADNFLSFLEELKKDPEGSKLMLTAAVGTSPFIGANGSPMTDVSKFADIFDFIAIMAYDIWGSWTDTLGPNAPLEDSCAPSPAGSGASAVKDWVTAGFPVDQIVLGVAAYGRAYTVSSSEAAKIGNYPTFDKTKIPAGEGETVGTTTVDQCGVTTGTTGVFNFGGLIEAGFLECDGSAAEGKTYKFDTCSQTPFVYDPSSSIMVSYDDASSFAAKGKYIKDTGLKGFAMWHAIGDSDDILLDSISQAMDIEFNYCS